MSEACPFYLPEAHSVCQAKTYYNTQNFFIVGAVIHLGDEFASSLFAGNQDLLNKLLASYNVAENPRAFLHKAKVKLQYVRFVLALPFLTYVVSRHRQMELCDDPEATETIAPLTKAHFIKPPSAVRDWSSKLIGKWFLQELSKFPAS